MIRNVRDQKDQVTYTPYNPNPRLGRFYSNHLNQTYNENTPMRAERQNTRLPVIGDILSTLAERMGIKEP
jgi:hypothetical protein